jgi:hypothetical protein
LILQSWEYLNLLLYTNPRLLNTFYRKGRLRIFLKLIFQWIDFFESSRIIWDNSFSFLGKHFYSPNCGIAIYCCAIALWSRLQHLSSIGLDFGYSIFKRPINIFWSFKSLKSAMKNEALTIDHNHNKGGV